MKIGEHFFKLTKLKGLKQFFGTVIFSLKKQQSVPYNIMYFLDKLKCKSHSITMQLNYNRYLLQIFYEKKNFNSRLLKCRKL